MKRAERPIVIDLIDDIHDTTDVSNADFNKSTRRTVQTTSDHKFDIGFVRLNRVTYRTEENPPLYLVIFYDCWILIISFIFKRGWSCLTLQ